MSLSRRIPVASLLLALLGGCGLSSQEELFGVIDPTPPRVVATVPEPDWIQVPPAITVRVWFSEAVDPASVGPGSIYLISGQDLASVRYLVEVEPDGRGRVSLDPQGSLIPGVLYLLRITERVSDLYGNPLEAETRVEFKTLR